MIAKNPSDMAGFGPWQSDHERGPRYAPMYKSGHQQCVYCGYGLDRETGRCGQTRWTDAGWVHA